MFRRVLRRLRGLQSPEESIDSASSDDGPDNSEAWVAPEAKARMLAVARTPAAQPDPPSHTDTPPPEPEAPPPPPPPPLRTEDDRSQQLAVLLAAANDDEEADGIIEQFATPEGRARLISDASEQQQSVEERRDSRRHSHRARRARSEADDLVASDDDETPVIMESIRMNPEQTDGVTTRRGTVVGRNKKISETKSVPLTEKRTRKENFIERNRRARMERAVRLSRNPKEDKAPPRRSTRLRRIAELEEADCSDSDQSSAHSDCSMRSTGSAGANDEINSDSDADADEAAPDTDSDAAEEEAIAAVVEEESEEEDEDFVIKRKRTKGASSKRPPAGSNRRSSGRLRNKRKPAQSPSKDFLGRRKKTKRRRTDPNSVFESPQTFLTAEERRERLEALVKQTADIARDLNAAMTAEKERDEAAAVALAAGGTGRVVKKKISEGELFWPTGPGLSMQPHQIDGVRWLLTLDSQGLNAILADEMGLGKTIQSITFLATILSVENRGPHIIIAPKNVVPHWATEVETWYPGKFKVVTHIGAGEERFVRMTEVLRTIPDFDILVTTFDLAIRDFFTKPRPESALSWQNRHVIRSMQNLEFEYAVVDEAHRLKNTEAKFTSGLRKFTQARRRLLLTGTPLSNNLQELWALMNVLNPRIFGSQGTFDAWFAAPFDTSDKRNSLSINEQSLIVDRLHTVLRPFFRRRLRADVCPSFSSADEVVIRCPQSALQKALSAHYRRDRKNRDLSVNNIVMQLRKIANHPYIVSGALFELSAVETPRGLVGPCGKFLFLYHVLPRLIAAGHRVLIFSQFRRVLDFIEDLLDMLKFKYGRLDGDTTNEDRENTVANFNKPGCDVPIFLLTTRAGGVGLNLQSADTVILFDSDWNPSADLQAVSRIQRIGQKRTVHIMRLVTDNSIDEVIVERGRDKLRTEAVAVGAGKFNANVDPAADSAMRQRDLEQILAEYEARQNKRSSPDAAPVPIRGRDDPAGAKAPATSVIMKECFERWEPQLLRNGETGLPSFEGTVQPLIESPETVPEWIRIGCNARCASLALKCQQPAQVPAALEKGRLQNAQNDGALPTKRERRARFNFKGVYDGLSADDESEFEGPNASQESSGSDSDVQFVPDELTARIKSRARLVPKSETVPVQYPSMQPYNYMPPNGYTAPVTGAGFGRITADMMALNNPVQANGYVAPIVQGAFDPVPVQMGQGPTVIVTRDPSLAGPRPIAPRSVQIPPVAPISVLPPPGMIPQPTFAPNGVYMGHPPVMPRQVGTSPTGIPIIDLNTDSDDDAFQSRPLAQGPAKKSSNLQAVAKAEKVRPRPTQPTEMQKARARKNEMAKERTQALEVAKEAYAKAKAQAVATGKTHVPAQVLSKSPVVGQSAVQENRAQSVATAPAPATSRVLAPAQTSVQSHDQKFSAVAPQPGAVASAANLAASSLAAVGATESDHGVDPKLITSLQHFTGVLDRGLLADVLVQCNNDLAMAANYILTCE